MGGPSRGAGLPGCRAPPLLLLRQLCQGDSSHLPPACPLAWLRPLRASRCPALLPVDLAVPSDAPGEFWAPRGRAWEAHISLCRVELRSSLWPTPPVPQVPTSLLALGFCPHSSACSLLSLSRQAAEAFLGIP